MEAKEVTQRSIDQAERGASKDWMTVALRAGRWLAKKQATMTSEDVREVMRVYYPDVTTPEPRAMGAAMRAMATRRYIDPTDRMRKSGLKRNHNRPQRVWRSRLYSSEE